MLHAVIIVLFELLPFSFIFVVNSSLSSPHDGSAWGVVVVDGGGAVLLSMFVWCLFVSGDERKFVTWSVSALLLISVKFNLFVSSYKRIEP